MIVVLPGEISHPSLLFLMQWLCFVLRVYTSTFSVYLFLSQPSLHSSTPPQTDIWDEVRNGGVRILLYIPWRGIITLCTWRFFYHLFLFMTCPITEISGTICILQPLWRNTFFSGLWASGAAKIDWKGRAVVLFAQFESCHSFHSNYQLKKNIHHHVLYNTTRLLTNIFSVNATLRTCFVAVYYWIPLHWYSVLCKYKGQVSWPFLMLAFL